MSRACRRRVLSLALLGPLALALAAGDWPHPGRDGGRSRSSSETAGSAWGVVWTRPTGLAFRASPAARDGVVLVADVRGFVRALAASNGAELWSVETVGPIESSPLALPGLAVSADAADVVRAWDLLSGALVWEAPAGGGVISSPLEESGIVYVGTGLPGTALEARWASTGALAWSANLGEPILASPVVHGGFVYAVSSDGILRSIGAANGAVVWAYGLPGAVRIGSPTLAAPHLFVPVMEPDAEVVRVHTDPAQWGGNWTTGPLADPNPPAGAATIESISSPVVVAGRVLVVVRFDHRLSSGYVTQEYLFAFDANTGAAVGAPFPILLGSASGSDSSVLPQARHCPAPVVVATAGGPAIVVASSVSATARMIHVASGALLASITLDGPSLASPVVANARIYFATWPGTVWCIRHGGNEPPQPPADLVPTHGEVVLDPWPVFSWAAAADPNHDPATIAYIVRVDDDGEILRNWDHQIFTAPGVTGATLPGPLTADAILTWSVRAVDPDGAMSSWADPRTFYAIVDPGPPLPPSNLTASPGDGQVELSWNPSPSVDVVGYELAVGNGPFSSIGNLTSYTVTGLTNGVPYTFRLRARDAEALVSSEISSSATPVASISLNGVAYPNLAAAAAAAQPGDTIRLGYGTFALSATLYLREGVSLLGISPHDTILVGNGADAVIQLTQGALPRGRIALLTISGGLIGVDTAGYAVVLENLVVRHNDTGLLIGLGSDALVKNDTIVANATYGVYNQSATGAARNNIILGNGIGLYAEPWAGPAPTYNNIHGNTIADVVGTALGSGNISAPVAFAAPAAGDYRVQPGQPTIDAGDPADDYSHEPFPHGWRINMGAYGNTPWAQFGSSVPPWGSGGGGAGGGGGGCAAGGRGAPTAWLALVAVVLACGWCGPLRRI